MDITRAGSQASAKGPGDWFTGTVRIDPLFQAPHPARAAGAAVTFEPGARTAWHTHPLGQTLIVTAGCGRAQRWGGPIEEIRPGDVVWFAPHEKLWPGKSEQQKRRLAKAITDDVMKVLRCGEESVSVAFEEVDANEWGEKVY